MSPAGFKEPIRLITIHGIGDPPPNYAYYFWQELETQLGIAIVHRSVWYGDLTRYIGLTNEKPWEGRLTARWADYALDVLKYTFDWGVRGEIRDRINQAFDSLTWYGKTLMVTHSWGGVVAWNHVPDHQVDLWVSFNTRRYLNTRLTRPPRVGKWVNVWSPEDPLSSEIKYVRQPENLMIHGPHSPLWTHDTKIDLTSLYWKQYLGRTAVPYAD